jgi:hypothetical protein
VREGAMCYCEYKKKKEKGRAKHTYCSNATNFVLDIATVHQLENVNVYQRYIDLKWRW